MKKVILYNNGEQIAGRDIDQADMVVRIDGGAKALVTKWRDEKDLERLSDAGVEAAAELARRKQPAPEPVREPKAGEVWMSRGRYFLILHDLSAAWLDNGLISPDDAKSGRWSGQETFYAPDFPSAVRRYATEELGMVEGHKGDRSRFQRVWQACVDAGMDANSKNGGADAVIAFIRDLVAARDAKDAARYVTATIRAGEEAERADKAEHERDAAMSTLKAARAALTVDFTQCGWNTLKSAVVAANAILGDFSMPTSERSPLVEESSRLAAERDALKARVEELERACESWRKSQETSERLRNKAERAVEELEAKLASAKAALA